MFARIYRRFTKWFMENTISDVTYHVCEKHNQVKIYHKNGMVTIWDMCDPMPSSEYITPDERS